MRRLLRATFTYRGLLLLAGVLVCAYAVGIVIYAQTLPDIGIRSAFTPVAKYIYPQYQRHPEDGRHGLRSNDRIVAVGPQNVATWGDLLWAPIRIRQQVAAGDLNVPELTGQEDFKAESIRSRGICRQGDDLLVRVRFECERTDGQGTQTYASWFLLGKLPMNEVVPSILWFFLKIALFVVGVLVFWKRPGDRAAVQFFFLCIITLGAYIGGYHWSHIITQPALLLGFMVCGVLLPAASLHFYLVFPRPKQFFLRHQSWTLLGVYGLPLIFLAVLIAGYVGVRFRLGDPEVILDLMRTTIYIYMGVAALWYLACVASLLYSFVGATDAAERNQVKWIFFGALAAVLPISYSFYLVVYQPEKFGGGAATWPMFGASVCFTIAFAISITQYRLMELDKLLSSGVIYFLISFLAGLAYYGVVFLGTLVFNKVIAGPSLTQALTVSTTALVLMLVLDLVRSRFKKALDRRFSRQKFQLDRTLQRMGQAIEQLVDPPTLAQRFLHASAELLGVGRGAIYLREGEPPLYRLAGSLGPPPPLSELSPGCPLIEVMQSRAALLSLPRGAAGSGDPRRAREGGQAIDPAQRQLRFLGGELAHALSHEGRLLALLVLGAKDREAYRAEDLNLLGAFAQITVLALESAVGHRTIEVLNRDLQAKVEKISEQQRRILALQSQLRKQALVPAASSVPPGDPEEADDPVPQGKEKGPGSIIGSSLPVRHLLDLVRKVSTSDAVVLIRGESGTGKEMLARALHEHSHRAAKPFVPVHCAAMSQGLLESELFGHVKGAFTGAHRDRVGRFELANGGTLFLDEIGDINLEVQTKLLRVLQEMAFERVGSSDPMPVDVRVIAATNQNLEQLIQQGRFREDLYFRLNVISIPVPPLRDRREDIPELALHFLRLFVQRSGKAVTHIDDDALAVLKSYRWPGNIRQLENAIARAVVVAEDAVITVQDLPVELVAAVEEQDLAARITSANGTASADLADGLRAERARHDRHERERLVRALAAAGGNKARAARALGLARSTLVSRLKKHGLS
jgi:transcriptional regulator with GAF, ATPase, and Fis domain